jgi:serine phosphatase RsbU (regulator of sigma subunit)/Tfp pilus assembly protein PilF
MIRSFIVCLICIFFFQTASLAQQSKIDSILTLLKTDKKDTSEVIHLYCLCFEYRNVGNYAKGRYYGNEAVELARSVTVGNKQGWPKGLSGAYNNLGTVYFSQEIFDKALENYLAALKIRIETNDKKNLPASYNNLGAVYRSMGNNAKAIEYYLISRKMCEELGDAGGIASSCINLGDVYEAQNQYEKALESEETAIKIEEMIGDQLNLGISYNNLGVFYDDQSKYDQALESYRTSLKIREKIGDESGIATAHVNIGALYLKQKKAREGKSEALLGLNMARKIGAKDLIIDVCQTLSRCDSALGNWKGAYDYQRLYKSYNDSVFNAESSRKFTEMNARYENDKMESQIKLLVKDSEKQSEVSVAENKRSKTILLSVLCGLALMVVFSAVLFNRWRVTQKQKGIILAQKKLVDEQKEVVDEKNKDITDSINYARRIQHAKLPKKEDIQDAFPESFVFFKPKDIVSGDFYFFHHSPSPAGKAGGEPIFIAAADCTGHGVPGAFMSLIGSDKLEEAVLQSTDASQILSLLNKGIKSALRQSDSDESTRDGMDIAFCSVDPGKGMITYAGANRPVWIIRKGQPVVEEIKATKKAIGGLTADDQHFDSHKISLQPGDTFYLFTDGFVDLFGGPHDKKITTRKFRDILLGIQDKSMAEQEKYLTAFTESWKGTTEQVDDILVIGVRI